MSDIHDIEVKICCIKLTLAARVIAMIGLVSNYLTCLLPVRSRIIIELFLMQYVYFKCCRWRLWFTPLIELAVGS